jgi:hypothetical protein
VEEEIFWVGMGSERSLGVRIIILVRFIVTVNEWKWNPVGAGHGHPLLGGGVAHNIGPVSFGCVKV